MTFIYDVEIFPNFFSIVYWSIDKSVKERLYICKEHNDYQKIVDLFSEDNNHWWVGYNSTAFDDPIMQFMVNRWIVFKNFSPDRITENISKYASEIIKDKYSKYNKVSFNRFDLMRVANLYKSLKMVGVNLKHDRIQDLPYSFDHHIQPDEVEEVLDYNENDVIITLKLYKEFRDEIKLRQKLSMKYNQILMNYPDSGIANRILENDYHRESGIPPHRFKKVNTKRDSVDFGEIIFSNISFQTKQLQKLLENIKQDSAGKDTKIEYNVIVGNTRYDILKGGLHSNMPPEVFESNKSHQIIDADVTSYYLYNIINRKIKPEHLRDCFIDLVRHYTEDRVKAKQEGDEVASDTLKIVALSLFGKMGNQHHWLYDLKALYQTTLNGQLFLLMLIEALELANIQVFYGNTDGITAIVPKEKKQQYYQICEWWEEKTGFNLEYDLYQKCIIRDVNNYIWIPSDSNKNKYKGFFDINRWKDVTKSFNKPVVPYAINKYFTEGISIEESITNHQDILDFCMAQKPGKKFDIEFHFIDDSTRMSVNSCQHTNRYYVGKGGGSLYKRNGDKLTAMVAGEPVYILNDIEDRNAHNYPIKYNYYIKEAYKIINLFNNKQQDLFL